MTDPAALRARLDSVRDRIARAAGRSGRDPSSVRLVAISKTFPAEDVRTAAEAGQIDFGENKVQDALEKISETSGLALTWHLVGHLQSNKARKAGAAFDVVQSVDGAALVAKLDEAASVSSRRLDLLVQVDLAGEPTKHGARPEVPGPEHEDLTESAAHLAGGAEAALGPGPLTGFGLRQAAGVLRFEAGQVLLFNQFCQGRLTSGYGVFAHARKR